MPEGHLLDSASGVIDCNVGDRVALDVHHVGQTAACSFGQRRPRRNRVDVFGPRRHRTQRLAAAPSAASEHHHRRHSCNGQIADLGAVATMANGADSAAVAPHDAGRGFDVQPPLAITKQLRADDELGHPDERSRVVATVILGQGSL